jgi:hypothetical protein
VDFIYLFTIQFYLILGNGKTTDLTRSDQGAKPVVEDLVEFPEENEIPVTVATNGQNLVFVGTNAALYEFNIKTKIVSYIIFFKVCT